MQERQKRAAWAHAQAQIIPVQACVKSWHNRRMTRIDVGPA